jgi:hypothetical protein
MRSAIRCTSLICLLAFLVLVSPSLLAHADSAAPPGSLVEIADVGKSKELATLLEAKGLSVVIPAKNMRVTNEQNNCVVWIGRDVPLETVRTVLVEALRLYPYLQFFYVVGDRGETPPEQVHRTIHVGGSIEAALVMKLNIIPATEMLQLLDQVQTIEDLHLMLHQRNLVRPGPAAGNS